MPDVSKYENENDWMGACTPKMMDEGKDKDQAVAACMDIWKEKKSFYGMSMDEAVKHYIKETKIGATISKATRAKVQAAHDALTQVGAMCSGPKSIVEDGLVSFGDEIKATDLGDGNVKLAGYLVRFGNPKDTDVTGDFFTRNTDFGKSEFSDGWFNHCLPVSFNGKRVVYDEQLPDVKLTKDDAGVFAEIILGARNEYEKIIAELGFAGKLGWSSGTASHLVNRKSAGGGKWEILRWPLGLDASLTPTPAEPRNNVIPIKSLITPETDMADKDDTEKKDQIYKEQKTMEKEELKAMFDENNRSIVELVKTEAETAAAKAVESVLDKLPEVKAKLNGTVQVTVDEADREFKTVGENLQAIADLAKNGRVHPRIKALQAMELKAALGSNEAIPSQGEFLLEPTITAGLLKPVHETGVFTQDVQKLPVGPNSNSGWLNGVDETSRASGSRWGGVVAYHLAEAGTKTASQPKFRRINWELHKLIVLQYATDEVLADAGMLSAIINQSSAEEIDFNANYDVLLGVGGDRPVGVLNSNALVSFARAATSAISHADIVAMWARLHPRSKGSAKWYISPDVHAQLDQLTFTSGSTGILSPYIGYGPDGVMRIYGRPVVETEFNPALGTLGDILLADMGQYLYWEKNGVESASSIHVQFLTDQTAFRFVYRYDGQTALASAITPANGGNTQSPFVALLATT